MRFRFLVLAGLLGLTLRALPSRGADVPPGNPPAEQDAEDAPPAVGPTGAAPGRAGVPLLTFEQRQRWVLDAVVANPGASISDRTQPFWVAEACFLRRKDDDGRRLAREGYLYWAAKDPKKIRATDFFRLWPAMDCYVRFKDRLDVESKQAFKRLMTAISCYSYSFTPNLSMLMWTTRLLGEQEWGADAFVPMQRDTTSHYRADPDRPMKDRLMQVVSAQAAAGGEEYASRPYGAGNLAPILGLAGLAADPTLNRRAQIAHETTLARYAPVWLRGAMIITSRRSYPDIFDDPMGVAEWFWVFFGGDLQPGTSGHALEAAVLGQPAPALIEHAATDRVKPETVLNRFQENSAGRQISWVTHDYGVFSESFTAHPRPFAQTYPFGVRWVEGDPRHHSFLWFTVPILDEKLPKNFPGSHPHGFDLDGQSTIQHEGSLLYVCRTDGARKPRYPYGLAFVPGGQQAVIDEAAAGRVFLHYPGVLIAFQATRPFSWDRTAPIRYASGTPGAGDSEFRVSGPAFAAALEAAPPADYPGATPEARLRAFRDAMVARTRVALVPGDPPAGSYTDRQGRVIRRTFGGDAQVDGKPVDFGGWPVASSRWVRQASRDAPLVVNDGQATRTYDLHNWTVTESPSPVYPRGVWHDAARVSPAASRRPLKPSFPLAFALLFPGPRQARP